MRRHRRFINISRHVLAPVASHAAGRNSLLILIDLHQMFLLVHGHVGDASSVFSLMISKFTADNPDKLVEIIAEFFLTTATTRGWTFKQVLARTRKKPEEGHSERSLISGHNHRDKLFVNMFRAT